MPKDRRYTRKELESLRRADLQSLFKMHGMKGANQSTKAMIDALVSLFESPNYYSPNKRSMAAGRPGEKQKRLLGGGTGMVKGPREVRRRVGVTKPVQAEEVVQPVGEADRVRTDEVVLGSGGPSKPRSPGVMPPPALPLSTSKSSSTSQTRLQEMLEARDRIWETRLQRMEEVFERRIKELEYRVDETLRLLSASATLSAPSGATSAVPQFTLTTVTPTATTLGKRTEREAAGQTPGAGPSQVGSSPVPKRARIGTTEEEDSDALSPHTPSPPRASTVPRTPSPSHQGSIADNSRTPGVGSDFFQPPPHFSASKRPDGEEEIVQGLPYPLFATTPRPSEPRSPTLDAPPSASRHRLNYNRGATLTPGRRKASPAPRSVSDAHKELTTITESDEPSLPVSLARRRVASENTPTRLVPASMRGGSVPVSPPQLSPSPSIGASEREGGFTFTPFPPVPRANLASGLKKTTVAQRVQSTPDGVSDDELGEPPRREMNRSVSPLQDYMDVAMHGILGVDEASSSMATPHRTMLGTERYRDTRFGDVPVVSWGSPSVDLGPNTPASFSRRPW